MREPPKPGDLIVVLYREGESKYGFDAGCGSAVETSPGGLRDTHVGVHINADTVLYRRLEEEGVEWARWAGSASEFERLGGWCDLVPMLLAARRLAGTGE